VTDVVVVAPDYTGSLRLLHQAAEIQALAAVPGYHRVPGRLAALQRVWHERPTALLHFTGHGVVQPTGRGMGEAVLRLEDVTLDVLTWRGLVAAFRRSHPFVFLNACDVGHAAPVANFVEGWAPTMLEVGASGYIGGLWTLGDQGAAAFATHFYATLQRNLPEGPVKVADLLRVTRRLFHEHGDPTFLAYVYYGDPNLQFTHATGH
jgi:CHAT domain-containing protein